MIEAIGDLQLQFLKGISRLAVSRIQAMLEKLRFRLQNMSTWRHNQMYKGGQTRRQTCDDTFQGSQLVVKPFGHSVLKSSPYVYIYI